MREIDLAHHLSYENFLTNGRRYTVSSYLISNTEAMSGELMTLMTVSVDRREQHSRPLCAVMLIYLSKSKVSMSIMDSVLSFSAAIVTSMHCGDVQLSASENAEQRGLV